MKSRIAGCTAICRVLFLSTVTFISYHLHADEHDVPIGSHYDIPILLDTDEIFMSQPEVFDINGDGRPDVAFSNLPDDIDAESALEIWASNETGTLELSTDSLINGVIPSELRGYRQIIPGDFNGDGRLDLFLESLGPEPDCGNPTGDCWPGGMNSLLLSDEQGKLNNVTATHLPNFSDFSHGSAVLDFDGDGDMDIFVNSPANSFQVLLNPPFPYLLENDGSGFFTVVADLSQPEYGGQIPLVGRNGIIPEDVPFGYGVPWYVAIDANGDGHTDLQPGRATFSNDDEQAGNWRTLLMLNDGNGSFDYLPGDAWPAPSWVDRGSINHSRILDLNNDGLDDQLLVQIHEDTFHWVQVLISNGDGTFRDETSARYPYLQNDIWQMDNFQLHDLDGDGHLDLFNAYNFSVIDIRINDGEGYFRALSHDWVEVDWNYVVLDVDNDGGTDFLTTDYLGVRLHKMKQPYGPEMEGTDEDDRLIGGAHDNDYRGKVGNDVLDGGLGDDLLAGGAGDDELIGGKGNDRLKPGPGSDSVDGGPDRDTVEYDFPINEANINHGFTSQISSESNDTNDQVQATEYALFGDGATPLPIEEQSAIQSLNGVAGLWYDPDLDGEGFNVITASTGTVIFYYGFNADGDRLWLISESLPNELAFQQVFDLQMYEADGGTFSQPAPSSEALSEWGRLKGVFDACGDGRFALHGKDGVKISYQTRLAGITNADCVTQSLAAPSGLAGLWYDPVLDGEGYNFIITETATIILFYGYTANGQRLWLISEALSGAPQVGATTTLTMYVSTDGTFDEPLASSEVLEEWGELQITVNSCTTAIANLNGDDGEKTSNLDKLAGIDQSTCP